MYGPLLDVLFWFVAIVGGTLLAILLFVVIGIACGSLPGLGMGSVHLECPHCGRQTPSHLPECTRCGRSFREEVAEDRPLPVPPKLQR
jgi:DNA-directed RNA polymerase subunit RPC12/RpoP